MRGRWIHEVRATVTRPMCAMCAGFTRCADRYAPHVRHVRRIHEVRATVTRPMCARCAGCTRRARPPT